MNQNCDWLHHSVFTVKIATQHRGRNKSGAHMSVTVVGDV